MNAQEDRPLLDGVVVLDLTQYLAGPYCTMLLADAGATVYKVERPKGGDPGRRMGPFIERDGVRISTYFTRMHRNKRSVALDIGSPAGRDAFLAMVGEADVVVENFKPGVMERLGLPYEALRQVNPGIIYASVSGYGHEDLVPSPNAGLPSYDIVVLAEAGVLGMIGDADGPPLWPGFGLGDLYPATTAAMGISMALLRRTRDGQGGRVDCSMIESALVMSEGSLSRWQMYGENPRRGRETTVAPYSTYRCRDGYVALAVVSPKEWQSICGVIGASDWADDAEMENPQVRVERSGELRERIEGWLADVAADEAVSTLLAAGVPAGVVALPERVYSNPHLRARGAFVGFADPPYEGIELPGPPVRVEGWLPREAAPPPQLGSHTEEALRMLGSFEDQAIDDLADEGVIGR